MIRAHFLRRNDLFTVIMRGRVRLVRFLCCLKVACVMSTMSSTACALTMQDIRSSPLPICVSLGLSRSQCLHSHPTNITCLHYLLSGCKAMTVDNRTSERGGAGRQRGLQQSSIEVDNRPGENFYFKFHAKDNHRCHHMGRLELN